MLPLQPRIKEFDLFRGDSVLKRTISGLVAPSESSGHASQELNVKAKNVAELQVKGAGLAEAGDASPCVTILAVGTCESPLDNGELSQGNGDAMPVNHESSLTGDASLKCNKAQTESALESTDCRAREPRKQSGVAQTNQGRNSLVPGCKQVLAVFWLVKSFLVKILWIVPPNKGCIWQDLSLQSDAFLFSTPCQG